MARELSRLEQKIYSIGLRHLPKHPHQFILKEWDFYGKSIKPYGRLTFSCSKCDAKYSFDLSQDEQIELFNIDNSKIGTERYFTL